MKYICEPSSHLNTLMALSAVFVSESARGEPRVSCHKTRGSRGRAQKRLHSTSWPAVPTERGCPRVGQQPARLIAAADRSERAGILVPETNALLRGRVRGALANPQPWSGRQAGCRLLSALLTRAFRSRPYQHCKCLNKCTFLPPLLDM